MTTILPSIAFENPAWAKQRDYVRANARQCKRTLRGGEGTGLTVLICGSGPSLAETYGPVMGEYRPDAVWGCNAALKWLWETDRWVSHGVAVAGEEGLLDDWKPFPPVHYYVSSGVWPVIPRILQQRHRTVWFYHTILGPKLGVQDERALYASLFPAALCVMPTGGFNVTNIAVALAIGLGFARIIVAGADCCLALQPHDDRPDAGDRSLTDSEFQRQHVAWKDRQRMYVDGRSPVAAFGPDVVIPDGVIAGRRFAARPDMLLSAVHLVDLVRRFPRRVILVGDTLPNWLLRVPEAQWRDLMPKVEDGVVTNFQPVLDTPAEGAHYAPSRDPA